LATADPESGPAARVSAGSEAKPISLEEAMIVVLVKSGIQ